MNWHYLVFDDYDKAVAIANREAQHKRCRFSVVMDRYGNYSVWPGVLGENEACYVALIPAATSQATSAPVAGLW